MTFCRSFRSSTSSILPAMVLVFIGSSDLPPAPGPDRQAEEEAAAFPGRAVELQPAAVGLHDLVRERQAHAEAFAGASPAFGPEVAAEHLFLVLGRDPDAGVLHEQDGPVGV